MKLLPTFTTLCLFPFLAAGQGGNFEMTFTSGAVADTGTNPLDELTFTLDYTVSANVNSVDEPEAYEGACTESPPATRAALSTVSGITDLVFSTTQIVFKFDPLNVPGSWEPTVNTFVFCVYMSENNNKVFEEVTIDLTISHDTYDDTPVVTFDSSSNNIDKTTTLSMNGKAVKATAALCDAQTVFNIGEEICVQLGLDAAGEYFGYKLDDGSVTALEPFTQLEFTTGGLTDTITPASDDTAVVNGDNAAVNSKKVYFYLSNEFFYSGSRTVTMNGVVNIVDTYGNAVVRRLQVMGDFHRREVVEEVPGQVHDDVSVRFTIVPVNEETRKQAFHHDDHDDRVEMEWIPETVSHSAWCTGIFVALIVVVSVGAAACCCCFGAAIARRRKKEEEEKRDESEGTDSGTDTIPETVTRPVPKTVTFTNSGGDPQMEEAVLYYENTRWGSLGKGEKPIVVSSYPGQQWYIVVNGQYVKLFTVGEEDQQAFRF